MGSVCMCAAWLCVWQTVIYDYTRFKPILHTTHVVLLLSLNSIFLLLPVCLSRLSFALVSVMNGHLCGDRAICTQQMCSFIQSFIIFLPFGDGNQIRKPAAHSNAHIRLMCAKFQWSQLKVTASKSMKSIVSLWMQMIIPESRCIKHEFICCRIWSPPMTGFVL